MIFANERPPQQNERRAEWAYKAAIANKLITGPRFNTDFDRIFAREYEAEQIADSAPSLGDSDGR